MEWLVLILWLSIINGALGGQYILNWMGNQPRFVGDKLIGVSPGVMTWWRELSKLTWAVIAVTIELMRGKKARYLWPGGLSMVTIMICAFTGVIENIGFFYLPRFYSPHVYAPFINIYLAFLPFFGKLLFNAPIRKEHWIGITLVIIGISVSRYKVTAGAALDTEAIVWILIINACLLSQQVLNNKTVQTALPNVGPNALVVWREIWKMVFISAALFIFPLIAEITQAHLPSAVEEARFKKEVLAKVDDKDKAFLLKYYSLSGGEYKLAQNISTEEQEMIKEVNAKTDLHRFYSLFEGSILPKNWWPILFVVLAGLTGYIYSFGFFKLSKFAAHFWVPYTNIYLALLPFIMLLFGENVTMPQIIGAVIVTLGLIIGVSDYKRNKVVEIEKKFKDE